MSDLRDDISELIFDGTLVNSGEPSDLADAILAAVAEALTSEDVVAAAGNAVADEVSSLHPGAWGEIVESEPIIVRDNRTQAQAIAQYIAYPVLRQALRAAGIAKGEGDE